MRFAKGRQEPVASRLWETLAVDLSLPFGCGVSRDGQDSGIVSRPFEPDWTPMPLAGDGAALQTQSTRRHSRVSTPSAAAPVRFPLPQKCECPSFDVVTDAPKCGHHLCVAASCPRRVGKAQVNPFSLPQPERAFLGSLITHGDHEVEALASESLDGFALCSRGVDGDLCKRTKRGWMYETRWPGSRGDCLPFPASPRVDDGLCHL